MFPLTIADYYRQAVEAIRQQVGTAPDDNVVGMDTDECFNISSQDMAWNL